MSQNAKHRAPARAPRGNDQSWDAEAAPNAPVGKEYDASKTLKRLKYLETILASPNMSFESLRDAKQEKARILASIDD